MLALKPSPHLSLFCCFFFQDNGFSLPSWHEKMSIVSLPAPFWNVLLQRVLLCDYPAAAALLVAAGNWSRVHARYVRWDHGCGAQPVDCEGRGASARIGLGGIQLSDSKAMIDGGSTLIKTPPLLFAGIVIGFNLFRYGNITMQPIKEPSYTPP